MRDVPWLRRLLWPVSLVWGAAVRLRAFAYRAGVVHPKRLPGTVISVGNLTAGGTGKTPMVLWLAERAHADGKRVGILTRGYRARIPETPGAPQSDEVAIYRTRLAHHVQLGVGSDRYANGMVLARHGVEWFLLDDGFQHLQLARDVDIVLLDATNPFGGGRLLPAGMLREQKSALSRANIIVITRSEQAPAVETIVRRYTNAPIFHAVTELKEILPLPSAKRAMPPSQWPRAGVFAFCGIGNPQAFFADLERWGIRLAGRAIFADHHRYTQQEAAKLEQAARESGADALICTEKDVFNLRDVTFSLFPVGFARIAMRVSESDNFWRMVLGIAEHRRVKTAS